MRMAGIVASTLRRRTFRHKQQQEFKLQLTEGHLSLSPSNSSYVPSRSQSFSKRIPGLYTPQAAKLNYQDFWPLCVNPEEGNLNSVNFESFDTLIPRANRWLQEHIDTVLVKCETVERKVCSIEDVMLDNPMFCPSNTTAISIKGLRLWFVHDPSMLQKSPENIIPLEIGYMNIIPKCLDSSAKYPLYENLPETYAAINAYLTDNHLDGKIVTIETIGLKLSKKHWEGPSVDPDKTCYPDEYLHHVLYITRIYFIYGPPEEEYIGAQDFLPDFLEVPKWRRMHNSRPCYGNLRTAMDKAQLWLASTLNFRVANIQMLEAVYRRSPENVHTGVNFIDKVESCLLIRFVRVTYVRPQDGSTHCVSMYSPPRGFSYKTFVPAAVKVALCSGRPEYENITAMWERSRAWLRCVDRRVVGVETFYHSLNRAWQQQDLGESTVMTGEWTSNDRGERHHCNRKYLVQMIRVYLDGQYSEPPVEYLPPAPQVEEVNDCCLLM